MLLVCTRADIFLLLEMPLQSHEIPAVFSGYARGNHFKLTWIKVEKYDIDDCDFLVLAFYREYCFLFVRLIFYLLSTALNWLHFICGYSRVSG